MALVVHLKYAENLKGRSERLAKVTFRDHSHVTKTVVNMESSLVFDEVFEWPVARPVEADEVVDIELYTYNKYVSNRLLGTFRMILQELIEVGNVKISDCLLDTHNIVTQVKITFELTYHAPDGSLGVWREGCLQYPDSDGLKLGGDGEMQEQGVDKLKYSSMEDISGRADLYDMRASSKSFNESTQSLESQSSSKSNKSIGKRTMGHVTKLTNFMRPKYSRKELDDYKLALASHDTLIPDSSDMDGRSIEVASMLVHTLEDQYESAYADIPDSQTGQSKRSKVNLNVEDSLMKAQDFQVCVTVVEARQLAGLNMDPVVCVQIGDQKKYTSVKESTNCPYYNEYFVFDFHLAPLILFDKIITLTVVHSRNFMRSGTVVGSYKFDVAAVYRMPDHQFYHKWAMLMDPDDIGGGVKGYLKCDIAVIGKGDSIKAPPKSNKEEDDIEGNLLLPDGIPADRQMARYVVRVFKAEGLPKMNTGIIANVKKAIMGEISDLVDPYVEVHFCGHKAKTSVKKGCYEPTWNEQVVFTEMFPPLCRRIRVQLRDSNNVNDEIIGTYFLDLSCISNEGEKGFLPTYGPSWVNLYGSTRAFQIIAKQGHLNDGLGEGVSYRGRLLIALNTEIISREDNGAALVEVELAHPISETAAGSPEEYFLFGTFLEASMIDRKIGDKPIHFEISIGNAGNVLDGYNAPYQQNIVDRSEESSSSQTNINQTPRLEYPQWVSVTPAVKPVSRDKYYYHLPYYEDKPCVYVREKFEDHRRRMYNSNIISKICDMLDEGLSDIHHMIETEQSFPEQRLMAVMNVLGHGCSKFVSLVKGTGGGSAAGKTRLDKERLRLLVMEMNNVSSLVKDMPTVTKSNLTENLKTGSQILTKLRCLASEPQHGLPDVFIWMVTNNRRIAYQRIPARDIIYSTLDEERGKDCGRPVTLFLRLPGNKAIGSAGWTIQAKLQVFFWLGLLKHKKDFLRGLPKGYEETKLLKQARDLSGVPPPSIRYIERLSFQLRAHIYQARQLIGSDDSGLSDPFARLAFCYQSVVTQVVEQTLSPTWNEMLVLDEVEIHGHIEQIVKDSPMIVVEVFDQDKTGKPEFIGRALCKPVVKMSSEAYNLPKFPPCLEWWDIYRGPDKAGELLAVFELLQKPFEESDLRAAYETPPCSRKATLSVPPMSDSSHPQLPPLHLPSMKDRGPVLPVPKGVRPILSKHRIEVLFWGVRELKRLQLQSVDHPRIDIECSGHILSSSVITNIKKNPNFEVPVKHFDVELPDNDLYCPPITIRCVDSRSFGRYTLVGTHIIGNLHKFKHVLTATLAKDEPQKLPLEGMDNLKAVDSTSAVSVRSRDVTITLDNQPVPTDMEHCVTIDSNPKVSEKKTDTAKDKKKGPADEEDLDIDALDWWSKYFASVESMKRKQEQCDESNNNELDADGNVMKPANQEEQSRLQMATSGITPRDNSNIDVAFKHGKKLEKESKKKTDKQQPVKGMLKISGLVNQFSPKALQKDTQMSGASPLKKFCKKVIKRGGKQESITEAIETCGVYPNELESQVEFHGFKDWLHTFELYRGKNLGNGELKENRIVGKFKGSMKIIKFPLAQPTEDCTAGDPAYELFQGLPSNEPVKVLVRVYVVKANDLHPADINGKADPYLVVRLGSRTYNDKENYISKQLNPIFGRCFEFEANFPMESMLTVQVFDWDLIGSDDLIGETKIDLENRFYSRHRATCGLALKYDLNGYNAWRDFQKPTQILAKLCKDGKIDGPHYQSGKVRVANRVFMAPLEIQDEHGVKKATNEHLALAALNNWSEIPKVGCHLVPEHVETRPLFQPEKPGIEQGKIEMFVDMFPMDMPAPGPPMDISPRKPKSFELRCIIWNTDEVVLEDDALFTGEKMSDIYVKGWMKGGDDMQATDIHYRSLTGEGNFNWRFVFPFDYLVAEEKIVISRKETMFSWDETESKMPARLSLQVWDADHFSADDFLGSLTLDLNRFPRGAKSSRKCSLAMMKTDGSVPQMSLFKQKRVKGWWPFHVKNEANQELELTGKVEAELHLMTAEDAEKNPAGLGRSEPDPLEKPNRPDTSFMWFMSPFKSLRYIICHNYKWTFLKILGIACLAFLIVLFFYNIPGYTVKKMLNV